MTLAQWLTSILLDNGTLLSTDKNILDLVKKTQQVEIADPNTLDQTNICNWNTDGPIVLDVNSLSGQEDLQPCLARLRDLSGQRIFAFQLDHDAPLTTEEYVALGYRIHCSAPPYTIYQFNFDDYKKTPDWLNNRFWANPERWDKDRW